MNEIVSRAVPSAPLAGEATGWYAVHTQAHAEPLAEQSLGRVCARVFCPRYRRQAIVHGYRRWVSRSLFPGYLFAAFDLQRDFRSVQYARGVRAIVMCGGEVAEVPDELIATIERRQQDGYVLIEPAPLEPGRRYEITTGPFQGHTGIFQAQLSGAERVALLLDALRYNARVIIDRLALRPV